MKGVTKEMNGQLSVSYPVASTSWAFYSIPHMLQIRSEAVNIFYIFGKPVDEAELAEHVIFIGLALRNQDYHQSRGSNPHER
jgi:hypothetical protein